MIKLRKPWLVRPAGTLLGVAGRLLIGTVRRREALAGPEQHPPPADGERYIYVFWHEALVLMAAYSVPAHVLTSQHADGELFTRVARQLKLGVIRGSTTRGGSAALLGLIRRTGGTHVVLTPDGPRGPRRQLKPGAVALASMTGMPIVPVGVACPAAWRPRTWDRAMIPPPWATAYYVSGPAIRVPGRLDRGRLNWYCRLAEAALGVVTAAAERWAAGGPRPIPAPRLAATA